MDALIVNEYGDVVLATAGKFALSRMLKGNMDIVNGATPGINKTDASLVQWQKTSGIPSV
jgi:hypothetical protein